MLRNGLIVFSQKWWFLQVSVYHLHFQSGTLVGGWKRNGFSGKTAKMCIIFFSKIGYFLCCLVLKHIADILDKDTFLLCIGHWDRIWQLQGMLVGRFYWFVIQSEFWTVFHTDCIFTLSLYLHKVAENQGDPGRKWGVRSPREAKLLMTKAYIYWQFSWSSAFPVCGYYFPFTGSEIGRWKVGCNHPKNWTGFHITRLSSRKSITSSIFSQAPINLSITGVGIWCRFFF